jgi:hypothetical protein|mmetsp:Transcript_34888/g.56918  ORF Transcript_34888/g.56918 Transcript_34888/m.56918 type:complete len:90 (+) Transcript_34888:759-1028(+)
MDGLLLFIMHASGQYILKAAVSRAKGYFLQVPRPIHLGVIADRNANLAQGVDSSCSCLVSALKIKADQMTSVCAMSGMALHSMAANIQC